MKRNQKQSMTEKDLLTGLLSTAYQMDETGVASLYNEDGTLKDDSLETLKAADVQRVQKLKPDTKKFFDDGYKKAQSESLSKFEKELTDKFAIRSDKKGIELINEIVEAKSKTTGEGLTEENIKKSPYVVSLLDKHQQEIANAIKQGEDKFTGFQKELSKKETLSKVLDKAQEVFNGFKPVLSQDAAKAKAQSELFLNGIARDYEFEIQGDRVVIMKDGKLFEDAHGNPYKLDKLIKEQSDKMFDYHIADPKSSPGNGKPAENKNTQGSPIAVPKNDIEYAKIIHDSTIPVEKRMEVRKAYEESKQIV